MSNEFFMVYEGKQIAVDKLGYLLNVDDWTPEMAAQLAASEDIELSDSHWEVVNFVRDFYLEFNTSPAIRALVNAMKQKLGEEKGNSRYLHRLFPKGAAKQATKIAGLPKPAKCL